MDFWQIFCRLVWMASKRNELIFSNSFDLVKTIIIGNLELPCIKC